METITTTTRPAAPAAPTPYRCPVCGRMSPARADAPVRPGCYACGKVDTTRPTTLAALPTITIMAPRQLHGGAGHYSPVLVQVVCSDVSLSRLYRTKRTAAEYVAMVVAEGKAVLV